MRAAPVASTSRPEIDRQVAETLAAVDWSKPNIVLYLRGISDKDPWAKIAGKIQPQLDSATTGLTEVRYSNLLAPRPGTQSGKAVLERVVEAVKARSPQMHVYLAGYSLGAWTIGDALAERPALMQAVEGAALVAHISVADKHYSTKTGPIREFNIPGDRFSMRFDGSQQALLATLDRLWGGITPVSVFKSLPQIVRNPLLFGQFARWRAGRDVPHKHEDATFVDAFGWLASQIRG